MLKYDILTFPILPILVSYGTLSCKTILQTAKLHFFKQKIENWKQNSKVFNRTYVDSF